MQIFIVPNPMLAAHNEITLLNRYGYDWEMLRISKDCYRVTRMDNGWIVEYRREN